MRFIYLTKRERLALVLLAAMYMLNWGLVFVGAYKNFPIIDWPMHFLGGFLIAYFFLDVIREALIAQRPLWKDLLLIVGASLIVGVLWELMEFAITNMAGSYFAQRLHQECCIGSLADTLKDLVMDSLGAITLFFAFRYTHRKDRMFR
jgi:hypothetical protein